MKQIALVLMLIALFSLAVAEANIMANNKTGKVAFAGKHAGMKFEGVFKKWDASLVLPPDENALIQATFDLTTAKTGDSTYDSTLPEGDWFDVENHPEGSFKSTRIVKNGQRYDVSGHLTLKGKTRPITFALIEKETHLEASFDIDRIAYGIGLESDPDAEWVSRDINMSLSIQK